MKAWRQRSNQSLARHTYIQALIELDRQGMVYKGLQRIMDHAIEGRFGRQTKQMAQTNVLAAKDAGLPEHWERLFKHAGIKLKEVA